jgi:hypothetical protein
MLYLMIAIIIGTVCFINWDQIASNPETAVLVGFFVLLSCMGSFAFTKRHSDIAPVLKAIKASDAALESLPIKVHITLKILSISLIAVLSTGLVTAFGALGGVDVLFADTLIRYLPYSESIEVSIINAVFRLLIPLYATFLLSLTLHSAMLYLAYGKVIMIEYLRWQLSLDLRRPSHS